MPLAILLSICLYLSIFCRMTLSLTKSRMNSCTFLYPNSSEYSLEACKRFSGKVAVGIDAREGRVAIKGWKENTSTNAVELAQRCEQDGASWIIYTDISRDGTATGVDTEQTLRVARSVEVPVIASGGVASVEDIRRLKEIEREGVEAVIVGRALYAGAFTLREAIEVAAEG